MVVSSQTTEFESAIESELRKMFESRELALYEMMSYHMGWLSDLDGFAHPKTSNRIHGVVCLTACLAAEGVVDTCLPAAVAVEMVHNFTQIHDDVQSGSPQRAGRDAVWWKWGPAQAINAGDGMHAMARISLFKLTEKGISPESTFRAVQMLDSASLALCEGRFQDLDTQERIDLTVDAYLSMASDKTGALYLCAAKLGALVAGADEDLIQSLGEFGLKIGLAKQIHDDLEELWSQEPSASLEVLNKKKLLPVVYAVQESDVSIKRRMGDIYFKRVLEPEDVESVRAILEETGAKQFAERKIDKLLNEALEAVNESALSPPSKDLLQDLVPSVLSA